MPSISLERAKNSQCKRNKSIKLFFIRLWRRVRVWVCPGCWASIFFLINFRSKASNDFNAVNSINCFPLFFGFHNVFLYENTTASTLLFSVHCLRVRTRYNRRYSSKRRVKKKIDMNFGTFIERARNRLTCYTWGEALIWDKKLVFWAFMRLKNLPIGMIKFWYVLGGE